LLRPPRRQRGDLRVQTPVEVVRGVGEGHPRPASGIEDAQVLLLRAPLRGGRDEQRDGEGEQPATAPAARGRDGRGRQAAAPGGGHTLQSRYACSSEAIGSRLGMNSWATKPSKPVSSIARMIAG